MNAQESRRISVTNRLRLLEDMILEIYRRIEKTSIQGKFRFEYELSDGEFFNDISSHLKKDGYSVRYDPFAGKIIIWW